MSASKVAIRYARAFVDALQDKDRLSDNQGLLKFIDLVNQTPELEDVLNNVAIKPASKRAILAAIGTELKLPNLVKRFLLVLAENRRLNVLPQVGKAVTDLVNERSNIQAVELITAAAVAEPELNVFAAAMGNGLNMEIRVQSLVDPNILGGAVARVGSLVYDGSVRGHLARLRRQLVKES